MIVTPILPGLSAVEGKLLTATFDAGRLSSDGGMIVLREIAERLDLAETITGPLRDDRDPGRVRHSYSEMAMARMVMIAAGYEDCDDVDVLRSDPALKIAVGRARESCKWAPTGCCMRCTGRHRSARTGAAPPSKPSAAPS